VVQWTAIKPVDDGREPAGLAPLRLLTPLQGLGIGFLGVIAQESRPAKPFGLAF
jgi:hypothetical protein